MKNAMKIVLLLISLFLLIGLVFAMLYEDDLPGNLANLLVILFLATLAAAFLSCIFLICRLLANGIRAIYNRIIPDKAKPLRSVKKRILVFGISLAVMFAAYHSGNAILSALPDDPSEYGSFTSKTTVSSDGRYTAKQEVVRPRDSEVRMVRVDVYDNNTGELADSFITERARDFWGICWEEGSYNIWIQSGDIGVYCFEEIDGKWIKNFDMERPESIISKYDKYVSEHDKYDTQPGEQSAVSSVNPYSVDDMWRYPMPE